MPDLYAHILTDRPNKYVQTIQKNLTSFSRMTAGPTVPEGVDLVFRDLVPGADMVSITDEANGEFVKTIETDSGTVDINFNGVVPKSTPDPDPNDLIFI